MPVDNLRVEFTDYDQDTQNYRFVVGFENEDEVDSGYEFRAILPDQTDILLSRFVNPENLDVSEITEDQTITSTGSIFIDSLVPDQLIPFGQRILLYLKVFRKNGTGSFDSSRVSYRTPVAPVADFNLHYNSRELVFTWTPSELEQSVSSYRVERAPSTRVQSFDIDTQQFGGLLLKSSEFKLGDVVVVHDILNDYFWADEVTTSQYLLISANNLVNNVSFYDYQGARPVSYNLYRFSADREYTKFVDISPTFFNGRFEFTYDGDDLFFLYRVRGIGGDLELTSNERYNRAIDITNKIPRLYRIYDSADPDYGNYLFFSMREALVDGNVYKKNQFSLPMKKGEGETYSFRGYTGVSESLVEVFVDGNIITYTRTDENGEFQVEFNPAKDSFDMSVVAYDKEKFSNFVPLRDIKFDKIFIYSVLSVIATQINDVGTSGFNVNISRLILETTDETTIRDYFARFLGLTYRFDDNPTQFREQVAFLYPLVWGSGRGATVDFVESVLDFYQDIVISRQIRWFGSSHVVAS